MAANVKVIEFYGLPGCGKTTLKKHILNCSLKNVGTIQDVMKLYKKEPLIYKITHLPIKKWWLLFLFIQSLPDRKKNGREFYIALYSRTLAYTYCSNRDLFDLVIVDHGLIQQVGSILHNMDYKISEKSLKRLVLFMASMEETKAMYCRIPCNLALIRIRERHRNGGRIDAVMDDKDKALYYLDREYALFEKISSCTNGDFSVLDMTKPTIELENDYYEILES